MKIVQTAEEQLRARSALVDAQVAQAFAEAAPQATVVAVGGYGRRELFPFSDVDLLLLVDAVPELGPPRDAVSLFQRQLWDAGLRVSHSERMITECCVIHDGNLELTISLLDHRLLIGEPARYQALQTRFPKFIASEKSNIIRHLCRMTRERHARYGGTIYHREPNVKEHPGGLRDLHVLHWLNQLGARSDEDLQDARDFLFRVRIFLHENAGRDNNLLSFEAQEAISSDPAAWMRLYYRNAREVLRALNHALHKAENAGGGLIAQFRDRRGRLSNTEFTVSRERVLLREPGLFESDPSAVFRLLQFVARHGLSLASDTERRLAVALPLLKERVRGAWPHWKVLLELPGCAAAFRALQDAGLLSSLIPEWSRIDALVTRDFYHRYTVDEHTLVALESLTGLTATSGEMLPHRFAALLASAHDTAALRLALLLHDIGKGVGAGEHASRSVRIAGAVLSRLGVPDPDRETVLFIIEHHLDLSEVITSRDLEDPATARFIATRTGTVERLGLLVLMTYADISAVNPQAMTPWRLDRLWRLYSAGQKEFTWELQTKRIHAGAADEETARFMEGFPVRYVRTHTDEEIRSHVELAREIGIKGAGVRIMRENGFYRADIVSPDRTFLVASLSAAFSGFGLNIAHAEVFSNTGGISLDTFVFSDPHRTLELNPAEMQRFREMLQEAALGGLAVREVLSGRPKPTARRGAEVEPSVRFNEEASENATLVEVVTQDRPGLLYDLAYAISSEGLNIEVVLINTEGHRALDVFYVTAASRKLNPDQEETLRAKLVVAAAAQRSRLDFV